MDPQKDPKKLGLKKLLENGNIEKFLEISEQQERTKARQEFNDLIKPFSMLGDVIAKHAKGVFVDEVMADVVKVGQKMEDHLSKALKEEATAVRKELETLLSETTSETRGAAIAEVERKVREAEARLTKEMTDKAVSEMNRLLPQLSEDAKLTEEEIEEITTNAALSVETQMDGLIAAYMADMTIPVDKVDGLKDYIQEQIPEVDFSTASIDWRQIKNVPNLSGGGAGARTMRWLNDVTNASTATAGQALAANGDGTFTFTTLAGSGDMTKAVYDTDNDGVVDQAAAIEGVSGASNNTFYGKNGSGTIGFHAVSATVNNLSDVGDVTITSIASGEILKWNGSAWINNTLAEAGIAAASHSHATTDITSGTFADARIAQSNVTQHQAALSITESQISDLGSYLTSVAINDVSDITITTPADNEVLAYNGAGAWINQTAAEAGLQPAPSEGAFVDGDKTKLDGIEASADVTDTANVTAAGALMDSELTDIVAVKALSDADVSTTNTGTSTTAFVTPSGLAGSKFGTSSLVSSINFVIDGGGSAITTGVKGYIEIPFACTINQVTLLADQTGSIVVDIWKDTYANYPPTDADSITASAVPTISSATKSQDATLTGWTTSVSAGDILGFNVDSITTCTRVTLSLKVTRT